MLDDLRAALGLMIERYGFETVSRSLRDMEARNTGLNAVGEAETRRRSRSRGSARTKQRRSAVDYVRAMEIPAERSAVVRRAAEEFERKTFLPTLGDIRSFCEAYGIEKPKSNSRAGGISRIFKFLVTMDATEVERLLDDRMFAGPASLGPIADAIRGKAKEQREEAIDYSLSLADHDAGRDGRAYPPEK